MVYIVDTSAGAKLLHWNAALSLADEADPLGLSLRVSARLAGELLFCITTTTVRARYYSFFPWAFGDYNDTERETSQDRGRIAGVVSRERAMVLGAVLHHGGKACEGGGLGGSEAAAKVVHVSQRNYDLQAWRHLARADGNFGAAYKGSLINLELFEEGSPENADESVSADSSPEEKREQRRKSDLRNLSSLGRKLAQAFERSVANTRYITEGWTRKDRVPPAVLREFGASAGLCELTEPGAADRRVLRDTFFANLPETRSADHERRRLSLLYVMEAVGKANQAGIHFSPWTFGDVAYFNEMMDDDSGNRCVIHTSECLQDIGLRWRVFHAQGYLALSLQALLVALLEQLRAYPAGIDHASLIRVFGRPSSLKALQRDLKLVGETDFMQRSALDALQEVGWISADGSATPVAISCPVSERSLAILLEEGRAVEPESVGLAMLLFYGTLLRYQSRTSEPHRNWHLQHVLSRYADISIPGVIDTLTSQFGERWLERPNAVLLEAISMRFLVRQHQMMAFERGGGTPLFNIDGTTLIPTEVSYTDPGTENGRLNSALQILCDLGLTVKDNELGYGLTARGRDYLEGQIKEQERRNEANRPA